MARGTIAGDTRVSENLRRKLIVAVAEMTVLGRWQVVCPLNNGRRDGQGKEPTVVTAFAAVCKTRVNNSSK